MELLIVVGLTAIIMVIGLTIAFGIIRVVESGKVRYYTNQVLINVAIWCLHKVEFKATSNRNMIRVVLNEAECLRQCI